MGCRLEPPRDAPWEGRVHRRAGTRDSIPMARNRSSPSAAALHCLAAAEVPREPVPTGGDRGDQAAGRHGHGHQGRDTVPIHLPRPPASSREDGVKGKVAPYP